MKMKKQKFIFASISIFTMVLGLILTTPVDNVRADGLANLPGENVSDSVLAKISGGAETCSTNGGDFCEWEGHNLSCGAADKACAEEFKDCRWNYCIGDNDECNGSGSGCTLETGDCCSSAIDQCISHAQTCQCNGNGGSLMIRIAQKCS